MPATLPQSLVVTPMDFNPTGYQQGILYLLSSKQESTRYVVRCIDKHYIDAVAPLFRFTRPYHQRNNDPGKKDYWCIKSSSRDNFSPPTLDDVTDWPGFCRAVVELQSYLDVRPILGVPRLRLRVYGQPDLLDAVCGRFPAGPKKMQHIKTNSGETYSYVYQSHVEIPRIIDYLDGEPKNPEVWAKWNDTLRSV